MIIGNFLITYVTEKFGIWYLSVWWKNRQDRKRKLERQLEIEEEERALAPSSTKSPTTKGGLADVNGAAQNVYLPQIDEGEMVDDSPVQKNRRKVPMKPIDEDEIEVDQEEQKNEDDVKDHSKSINHIRQSE